MANPWDNDPVVPEGGPIAPQGAQTIPSTDSQNPWENDPPAGPTGQTPTPAPAQNGFIGAKLPPTDPDAETPFTQWINSDHPTSLLEALGVGNIDLSGGGNLNPLNWGSSGYNPTADSAIPAAVVGGAVNIGTNIVRLGAAGLDKLAGMGKDGKDSPLTDAVDQVMPVYNPKSGLQKIVGTGTEAAGGFILGNKVGAALKVEGLATAAAEQIAAKVPSIVNGVTSFLGRVALNATQGVPGMMATTSGQDDSGVLVGDKALVTHLGLGPLLENLPTDSPDHAQNVINGRLNLGLDALLTGGGISMFMEGTRALYQGLIRPRISGKILAAFSSTEQLRNLFESMSEHLKTVTGSSTEKQMHAVWQRVVELVKNIDAQRLTKNIGIPGVDNIDIPLDVATTIQRQVNKDSPELDKQISSVFQAEAKKVGQKGYEKTATRREGPAQALGNALEQTQAAMGGADSAAAGATAVQDLGKAAVQQGQTERMLATNEAENTLGVANPTPGLEQPNIIGQVKKAQDTETGQLNELYQQVPADIKYEGASLHKIIAENKDSIPSEITDLLSAKENDGSFKYLNNVVRPEISRLITKLKDSAAPAERKELSALFKLKRNISEDQVDALKSAGRTDAIDAAQKAHGFYEDTVAPNRTGLVGQLRKFRKQHGKNFDDLYVKSRDLLRKEIGNPLHQEYEKRLWDVLASDAGENSEELITTFKNATDKAKALEGIEDKVYGHQLREFFERVGDKEYVTNPNGVASFEKLLNDPQSLDRVKSMIDMADKEGEPAVLQAMKYSYARALREKLNTGYLTELGSEQTSAQGIRKILSNDGFIQAGKEIFKDSPEFMDTATEVLSLANNIQRSLYLKAAPKGASDYIKEGAKDAVNKVVRAFYGPLSRPGTRVNTLWSTILDVLTPQGSTDRMMDALLADPETFVAAYQSFVKGENPKTIEKSLKVIFNALTVDNPDERKKFDKTYKQLNTNSQTDDALKDK
jgi:hypothetical protein